MHTQKAPQRFPAFMAPLQIWGGGQFCCPSSPVLVCVEGGGCSEVGGRENPPHLRIPWGANDNVTAAGGERGKEICRLSRWGHLIQLSLRVSYIGKRPSPPLTFQIMLNNNAFGKLQLKLVQRNGLMKVSDRSVLKLSSSSPVSSAPQPEFHLPTPSVLSTRKLSLKSQETLKILSGER